MTAVRFLLALFLAVAIAPVALAQDNGTIATEAKATPDTAIDRRIEDILGQIEGLEDVFATVRSGVVTLRGQVADNTLRDQAEELAKRVEGVVAVRNNIAEITDVSRRIVPAWERFRNRALQLVHYLPLLGLGLIIFAVIALAGFWLASRAWPWNRMAPNSFIAHLMRQVVRLAFIVLGIVVALDVLGASAVLGTILGAAGIVGLAVGFAVRDTVENYIASVLLSIRQPFRPNDWVEIGDRSGSVVMLTSRATILLDASGDHVRIPNATVFKGVIKNTTRNPERRFDFTYDFDASADMTAVMAKGVETLSKLPFALEKPGPSSWITKADTSSTTVCFTCWVDQSKTSYLQAKSEAIRLVRLALRDAGFKFASTTYRVAMEGGEAKQGKAAGPAKRPARATAKATLKQKAVADTTPDDSIADKVKEERQHAAETGDLLDIKAPQEL